MRGEDHVLRAISGSTFAARRAGNRHATAQTPTMTIGTATNVNVSCGLMPVTPLLTPTQDRWFAQIVGGFRV